MKQLDKILTWLIALGIVVSIPSCTVDSNEPKTFVPLVLEAPQQKAVEISNDFAFKFLANEQDENSVFSPLSISYCMSMLANAGDEASAREILRFMGYDDSYSIDDLNECHSLVMNHILKADNTADVRLANAVISIYGYGSIKPELTEVFEKLYMTDLLNTSKEKFPQTINKWIKDKTDGNLAELNLKPDPNTARAIVNAILFKGQWKEKFDISKTRTDRFDNLDGSFSWVKMMFGEKNAMLADVEGAETAKCIFGNGAFAFNVVLPSQDYTIDNVISALPSIVKQMKTLEYVTGDIAMPRFSFNCTHDIKNKMSDLGLDIKNLYFDFTDTQTSEIIENAIQGATITVDEDGATAAAATVVTTGLTCAASRSIRLDRPFVFFITEQSTGAILFMGKVVKM